MAGMMIRHGDRPNTSLMEFGVDSIDDIQYLPTTTNPGTGIFEGYKCAPMCSTCLVGNEGGKLLVYMLFSFGWKALNS